MTAIGGVRSACWHGDRYPATTDTQINRCVEFRIVELVNNIRPDNTDMRRAMGNKGSHVKSAHANDAHVRVVCREQQRPAAVVEKGRFRLDTRALHERERFVQNPTLGDCKDDMFGHNGRALGAMQRKGNMAETFGIGVMGEQSIAKGIIMQAEHCRRNGAPATARIVDAQLALMVGNTLCGERIANWPGLPLEDAMPLRLAGGFHHLMLTGADKRLSPVYRGEIFDQDEVDAIVNAIATEHDERLLPWFDRPPQTNEAGRSASFMAGLLWLSGKVGPMFELNELGASAGINTMMDRYHYNLGGIEVGPISSPMRIKPEWRGPPPPNAPVEIIGISGCDKAPVDLSDLHAALRVKSYVWPENKERIERIDAAIALAAQKRPDIVAADALDWVLERLSTPQDPGVVRVFNHSIVWQYIHADGRTAIADAIEAQGQKASPERPLAWIMLETNRATFRHELQIRYWPGPDRWQLLAEAQAHGTWIQWLEDAG